MGRGAGRKGVHEVKRTGLESGEWIETHSPLVVCNPNDVSGLQKGLGPLALDQHTNLRHGAAEGRSGKG